MKTDMNTKSGGISSNPEELEPAIRLAERLTHIGITLSQENDLDRLLEIILEEAKHIANADGGTLYHLTEQETLEFSIVRNDTLGIAFGGAENEAPIFPALPLRDPVTKEPNYHLLAAYAVWTQSAVNIPDVYSTDSFDFTGAKAFDEANHYRTQSVLVIPMINHKKEVLGCLQLVNAKDPASGEIIPFSRQTQNIVQSLASQASIILANKQLLLAEKELLESFIKLIAQAIDAKSPYTGAHCERVPLLVKMLAEAACDAGDGTFKNFRMSEEEKYELHIASWLHDCGKVTTPVHIMDKATKLETIHDRIELVKMRFEVVKRDAELAALKAGTPGEKAASQHKLEQIGKDVEFLTRINIGGEFMKDDALANLERIANGYTLEVDGEKIPVLSDNERYNLSIRRGTLTAEEREIMNDHMVHTCQMLESLPFPKHLRKVPEYAGGHHERMDGKGYPKGIRAGEMSIPARMMAVADVFEALTAGDRPYKSAKKLSEAMQIIAQMKKQHHLDPEIVDFFITSKVYLDYARQFLEPALIDAVDEAALLAVRPE